MKIAIGLPASPGTARNYRTGSWRTEMRPHFKHEKCTACDMCALTCPEGCIYGQGKNTYDADLDYCKGCGICPTVCPVADIEMVPEV